MSVALPKRVLIILVCAIGLAVFAAMLLCPLCYRSLNTHANDKARALISQTAAALFHRTSTLGAIGLPPTSLADAGLDAPNDLNEGIEVLVEILAAPGSHMNPFADGQGLINTDRDQTTRRTSDGKLVGLHEYADPWGNPYVYLRLQDFRDVPDTTVKYVNRSGTTIEVAPRRTADGSQFEGARDGYQIISMGADGVFGTDDDIVSWDLYRN
jgi:hypothetical protein